MTRLKQISQCRVDVDTKKHGNSFDDIPEGEQAQGAGFNTIAYSILKVS